MGWNNLSIPKLQRCNRWSLGTDKVISSHTLLDMWLLIHAGIKVKGAKGVNETRSPKWNYYIGHITLGAVSIRKTVLPGMAIPMLKIRRPNGRLIFNMEIAIRR